MSLADDQLGRLNSQLTSVLGALYNQASQCFPWRFALTSNGAGTEPRLRPRALSSALSGGFRRAVSAIRPKPLTFHVATTAPSGQCTRTRVN
jgi:hypothetical protein